MTKKWTITKHMQGTSLQHFLIEELNLSGRQAKRLLDNRSVFVNGRRIWMAKHKLKQNDVIEVIAEATSTKQTRLALTILYEDVQCMVIDKPVGILANGKNSCETLLQLQTGNPQIKAVHRLDKDTTGCLLFAKTREAEEKIIQQFKEHQITKQYIALVYGRPEKQQAAIQKKIDGQSAETKYRITQSTPQVSCIQVQIITGKTHQIRRHFHAIGHPVIGDKQYGPQKVEQQNIRNVPRQMLHASKLTFTSPHNKKTVRVSAPQPNDFTKCKHQLLR